MVIDLTAGACERNHFPGNDTHELSQGQGTNKKMRVDRLHLQTGNKMVICSHMINETSDRV